MTKAMFSLQIARKNVGKSLLKSRFFFHLDMLIIKALTKSNLSVSVLVALPFK